MPLATPYSVAIFLSGSSSSGNGRLYFLMNFLMSILAVDAASEHRQPGGLEFREAVAERARLLGASGRVILGIEVEDDLFASIIGQREGRDLLAAYHLCGYGGREVSLLEDVRARDARPQNNHRRDNDNRRQRRDQKHSHFLPRRRG